MPETHTQTCTHPNHHESISPWFNHTYFYFSWLTVTISYCILLFDILFSWALTHKRMQSWTNKEPLVSLHIWQTSQALIRSRLYIVAVCQVFLESAKCTKSHLKVVLLLLLVVPSQVSYSLSSSSFCLFIWFFVRWVLGWVTPSLWSWLKELETCSCT